MSIATEAEHIVNTSRNEQYGHPERDFARIAGAINALYGTEFEARDIPVIMAVVKLSRIVESPDKRDSWVDLIGYALTAEMVAEAQGHSLR